MLGLKGVGLHKPISFNWIAVLYTWNLGDIIIQLYFHKNFSTKRVDTLKFCNPRQLCWNWYCDLIKKYCYIFKTPPLTSWHLGRTEYVNSISFRNRIAGNCPTAHLKPQTHRPFKQTIPNKQTVQVKCSFKHFIFKSTGSTFFQQDKRWLYTWTSPDGQHQNRTDYILCSHKQRSSTQSAKTRPGADSIINSLLPNSDLNWRKWGKPLGHSGMT